MNPYCTSIFKLYILIIVRIFLYVNLFSTDQIPAYHFLQVCTLFLLCCVPSYLSRFIALYSYTRVLFSCFNLVFYDRLSDSESSFTIQSASHTDPPDRDQLKNSCGQNHTGIWLSDQPAAGPETTLINRRCRYCTLHLILLPDYRLNRPINYFMCLFSCYFLFFFSPSVQPFFFETTGSNTESCIPTKQVFSIRR